MSVKRQIFINNKDIDGKIANNTIFDFDFNVDKNILRKNKAKKESNIVIILLIYNIILWNL